MSADGKPKPTKQLKAVPSQKVVRTATGSFYAKTYLGVCRFAADKANKIEKAGKRTVIDIQLVTLNGKTTYVITHVPKDPAKPKFSQITFHTDRSSHGDLSLTASNIADRRYKLMQRGKHVFSTVYDVFYSASRAAVVGIGEAALGLNYTPMHNAAMALVNPGIYAPCHVTIFFRR